MAASLFDLYRISGVPSFFTGVAAVAGLVVAAVVAGLAEAVLTVAGLVVTVEGFATAVVVVCFFDLDVVDWAGLVCA